MRTYNPEDLIFTQNIAQSIRTATKNKTTYTEQVRKFAIDNGIQSPDKSGRYRFFYGREAEEIRSLMVSDLLLRDPEPYEHEMPDGMDHRTLDNELDEIAAGNLETPPDFSEILERRPGLREFVLVDTDLEVLVETIVARGFSVTLQYLKK